MSHCYFRGNQSPLILRMKDAQMHKWGETSKLKPSNPRTIINFTLQFSRSVVSDSLWPHELQHARPPCPSPTPRVHSNPCPSSQWCHPTISSFVIPFSSCPQSFPASGSFKWVITSHQMAKVLESYFLHRSFQWIFRTDFLKLYWKLIIS